MKKFVLLIIGMLLVNQANASCSGVRCNSVLVSRLYVTTDDGGKVVISTSGDEGELLCEAGVYGYLTIEATQPAYQEIYAFLLTAHTTQSPITVRTTDSGSCKILYVISDK